MIKFKKTLRGFKLGKFSDMYNLPCSVQKSSIMGGDAIWLGVDDPEPQIMAIHAVKHGIETNATVGWVPYSIPDEVLIHTRMHLNREQVAELIPVLQHFVETGELPESEDDDIIKHLEEDRKILIYALEKMEAMPDYNGMMKAKKIAANALEEVKNEHN